MTMAFVTFALNATSMTQPKYKSQPIVLRGNVKFWATNRVLLHGTCSLHYAKLNGALCGRVSLHSNHDFWVVFLWVLFQHLCLVCDVLLDSF